MSFLEKQDPNIQAVINQELARQRDKLEMIASENFVSQAVMEAQGSVLTNKYAEGYPGKRYYGGCENVDVIETLAIERAKRLFGAEHANVQPHSGSQANFGVYFALLQPGDTIVGMNLSHGGHLTHGSPVNVSGTYFNVVPYGVDAETQQIDYDEFRKIVLEAKPKLIIAGGSAYSRQIDFKKMAEVAHEVDAIFMVDMAHFAGLVAAGLHPNPVEYADIVTTTTHKTLRGPRGGLILCKEKYAKAIDKSIFPGIQGGPLMHVIAAKAVALGEALQPEFKVYAQQIIDNAKALAAALQDKGLTIVSGGTDTHVMLVDVRSTGLTGKEAEHLLDEVGITCNKNTIPFDPASPFVTSGIRLGTPALTTRGLQVKDMEEIADIILVGKEDEIKAKAEGLDLSKASFVDPENCDRLNTYIESLCEARKSKGLLPEDAKEILLSNPLFFGATMVRVGDADGMVAGAINSSANVLRAALQVVKTAPGTEIVSAFMLMDTKAKDMGENGCFVFADCGLNQNPNPEQLAAIASSSAKTFEQLIGATPRVAMLSHSTCGSAKHDDVTKVVEATNIAKEKYPQYLICGELQLDAAIVPEVAASKAPRSEVAGKANVLVFPDLDAGNIGYKLVQRLGGAQAFGPITQGIAKPVNDLSRGCVASDIVGAVAITCVQAAALEADK